MDSKSTLKDYIIMTACLIAVLTQAFLEIAISCLQWIHDAIPNVLDILFFDCLGWAERKNDEVTEDDKIDEEPVDEKDNI